MDAQHKPDNWKPKLGGTTEIEKVAKALAAHANNQRIDLYIWECFSPQTKQAWIDEATRRLAPVTPAPFLYSEECCPGHVASETDPKVCGRCGIHIDSLRPPEPDDH